ncbi:ABC transporter substrate-binding protein [Hyperthermus butylicus]|uniref:ABC-type Fe3+ transport system, periplasmic component n=1 Tax=Hyperthermus butylicus (strain DSM 5456 / JCM 9403 / PLM1-5) TaxID=415426 RepID=A2BIY3_HYPBU|nr:ABC transporter substrate-binding protein [Hyperthermus butylicus]ABM79944.1 ABC-type Fe3+ transport system, periplasmic component [Hyperthermus butylicus DSM 5456]
MASRNIVLAIGIIVAIAVIAGVVLLTGGKEKPAAPEQPTTPTTPSTEQPQQPAEQPETQPSEEQPQEQPPETPTQPTTECKEWIELTVLTRHPADIQEQARDLFLESDLAKRYCVKDITFIAVPPGLWQTFIEKQNIDVAWGGGPTLFDLLFKKGLLKPLETQIALEAASQVPDTFAGQPLKRVKDGKVYWVAAAIASFGFTINTEVAQQLDYDVSKLKSWRDLASDDLGLILVQYNTPALAIADPTQSTSNTRIYEIILQTYGWDEGWRILTLMAANARIEQSSGLVRDDVIAGIVMVGITIDFYGYTAERINPACKYILPEGETIVNGDPIAVTISTKHPEAAEAFIAWVLTEGQKIWLSPEINRLPANPKVFETPEGQQRPDLRDAYYRAMQVKVIQFNDTLALEIETAMRQYFKATLVDEHQTLQQAWKRLLEAYYVEKKIDKATFEALKQKLTDTVEYKDPLTGEIVKFTLEDARRVNKILEQNPAVTEKYMSAWREAARQKYEEVLDALGG